MKLQPRTLADAVLVSLSGRLDHENSDRFRDGLKPHLDAAVSSRAGIVLDFSEVEYISSAGLRALMLSANQAKAQKTRVVIASLQPVVSEIFEISRFNMVFKIFATVREALADISPAAAAAYDRG
jgi:anti-sigma B factor antagonist